MHNNVRLAVEQIAGNTDTLETALAAAVQYESAINTVVAKPGQAQRYGVAGIEITGASSAALSAPQAAPEPAGMQGMKQELAAITAALVALGVQRKAGNRSRQGASQEGRERQLRPARQVGQAQDALCLKHWDQSTCGTGSSVTCANSGDSTLRRSAPGRSRRLIISHQVENCHHPARPRKCSLTQTK
jgi:hypothetical protein